MGMRGDATSHVRVIKGKCRVKEENINGSIGALCRLVGVITLGLVFKHL